jgi:hypothetical protein
MPTWEAAGQLFDISCSSLHFGVASGFPISPGGSVTSMSFTFSTGGVLSVPSCVANLNAVRASNGCAPACRLADPSALNAPAVNDSISIAAWACAAYSPQTSMAAMSAIPASRARKRLSTPIRIAIAPLSPCRPLTGSS